MYSGITGNGKAQKYVLTKYFQGEPKKTDFKIVEEELPELKEGGILLFRNLCTLSLCTTVVINDLSTTY